ncbi:MAG TPA: acyl carrier protein [Spirochaetia bacterium]|nr:acyl carrier protein [Spirochaetia bacterium]
MSTINIQDRIKECIIERMHLKVRKEDIDNDAMIFDSGETENNANSFGLDSVDALDLVVLLNEEFDIEIGDDDMHIFESVNTIAEYIKTKKASA